MQAKNGKDSAMVIQSAFLQIKNWSHKNRTIFVPKKFEAIHCLRKRYFLNPGIALPPVPSLVSAREPRVIKPVGRNGSMRWLVVHFSPRLSFADQASKIATKSRQAAARLTMLGNTT